MAEKLKKLSIYMRPELKAAARNAAEADGLSLSAWFRKKLHQELERQAPIKAANLPRQPSH